MEHRRARRWPAQLNVLIRHQGTPVAFCSTLDISLEGAQLHCGFLGLEPGTTVDVDLSLPEGDNHYIRLPALVVHCAEGRMGVLFSAVRNEDVDALARFMSAAPRTDPETLQGGACYSIFL